MGGLITFAAVPRGGVWGTQLPGSDKKQKKEREFEKKEKDLKEKEE